MHLRKSGIRRVCKLSYDESFGISGRLLVYCQHVDQLFREPASIGDYCHYYLEHSV